MTNKNVIQLKKSAVLARQLVERFLEGANDSTLDSLYHISRAKRAAQFGHTLFIDPSTHVTEISTNDRSSRLEIECAFNKINLAEFVYLLNKFTEVTTCLRTFFQSIEFSVKKYKEEALDLYCSLLLVTIVEAANLMSQEGKTIDFEKLVNDRFPRDLSKLRLVQSHPDYEHAKNYILSYRDELTRQSVDELLKKHSLQREKLIKKLHTYAALRLEEIKRLEKAIEEESEEQIERQEDEQLEEQPREQPREQLDEQSDRLPSEQTDEARITIDEENFDLLDEFDIYYPDELFGGVDEDLIRDLDPISSVSNDVPESIVVSDSDDPSEVVAVPPRRQLPKNPTLVETPAPASRRRSRSPESEVDPDFPTHYRPHEGAALRRIPKLRKVAVPWTQTETDYLERGLSEIKGRNWTMIKQKYWDVLSGRDNTSLKDKAVNEIKRRTRLGIDLGGFKYAQR